MGRTYSCWMLNCWCITWPVGFKRLSYWETRTIIRINSKEVTSLMLRDSREREMFLCKSLQCSQQIYWPYRKSVLTNNLTLPLTHSNHKPSLPHFLMNFSSSAHVALHRESPSFHTVSNSHQFIRTLSSTVLTLYQTYVVGSKSFRPDQLFKVREIKQFCYFST